MRYFISVPVSSEDVKDGLMRFTEKMNGLGDISFMARENLHITALFLGDLDEDERQHARELFQGNTGSPSVDEFTCNASGVGVFPHMNFIKVVWAGVEPEEKFSDLHMYFSEQMNVRREHDYVPHITLGRVKDVSGGEKRRLQELIRREGPDFGTFQVSDVRLTRSELTPDGPVYTDEAVMEL